MAPMIEEYVADCEKDPELQSHDDKCRTGFSAFLKTLGDGHEDIDKLKHVIALVCEMNKSVTEQMISAEDEVVQLMAGEEECLKVVLQFFTTTSEVLDFCCALDGFVVSARMSHSYITHVIEKLQTDNKIETTDDDNAGQDKRNCYRRIVEELEKLKGSDMVDWSKSTAKSLQDRINSLMQKFDDMFKALKQYDDKLQKKLDHIRYWKKVTHTIFSCVIVGVAALAIVSMGALVFGPAMPIIAGIVAAHTNFLAGIAVVGTAVAVPGLAVTQYLLDSKSAKDEKTIKDKQALEQLMKAGNEIAKKELGDIKFLIDSLVVHIDSMVRVGKTDPSFAWKGIKQLLGRYLDKIEELEKESGRCTKEIREARDAVVKMIRKNHAIITEA